MKKLIICGDNNYWYYQGNIDNTQSLQDQEQEALRNVKRRITEGSYEALEAGQPTELFTFIVEATNGFRLGDIKP